MQRIKNMFVKLFAKCFKNNETQCVERKLSEEEEWKIYVLNRIDQIEDEDKRANARIIANRFFNPVFKKNRKNNIENEFFFSSLGIEDESKEQEQARRVRAYKAFFKRKETGTVQ